MAEEKMEIKRFQPSPMQERIIKKCFYDLQKASEHPEDLFSCLAILVGVTLKTICTSEGLAEVADKTCSAIKSNAGIEPTKLN